MEWPEADADTGGKGTRRALMAIGGYHPVRGNLMCLLDVTLACLLEVMLRACPTICRVLLKLSLIHI